MMHISEIADLKPLPNSAANYLFLYRSA